jgi:hypothetical protein
MPSENNTLPFKNSIIDDKNAWVLPAMSEDEKKTCELTNRFLGVMNGVRPQKNEEVIDTNNNLLGLNNHLFTQLERLARDGMSEQQLTIEIKRANAISNVAKNIIENGRLAVEAQKVLTGHGLKVPGLLTLEKSDE